MLLTAANDQSVAKPVEVNHEALKSEGKASIQLVRTILILHIFFSDRVEVSVCNKPQSIISGNCSKFVEKLNEELRTYLCTLSSIK